MPAAIINRLRRVTEICANRIIAILVPLILSGCAGYAPSRTAQVSRFAPVLAIHTQPMPVRAAAVPEPILAESNVQSIALLLPISGRFANPAAGVRDGFLAAHLASRYPRPRIHVYDSGETSDGALAAYDAAMEHAPDIVVGPLLREQVDALAGQRRLIRPVLALNYLGDAVAPPPLLYQFGLSPGDEARGAAASAMGRNLKSAVILVEKSEWGARTASSFREHYEALGGIVLDTRQFSADEQDSIEAIRGLLDRRTPEGSFSGDIETVFVAAGAAQTRLLIPQLRFFWHRPTELVIYGTAASYDRSLRVTDREGLRFCGMPAVLASDSIAADPYGISSTQPLGRTRLQGLGFDAYRVARAIRRSEFEGGTTISGKTGTLSVQDDGRILRRLSCSEVSDGRLQALDDSASASVSATVY